MQLALHTAQVIISLILIVLVIVQARSPGMANQDSSSMRHTRRGLEQALHQTTISVSALFLLLALLNSLPFFR